ERSQPERAWHFLQEYHADASATQRRQLLRLDQSWRWQNGHPWSVHDYLERFPALADDEETIVELLIGDYTCARQHGRPILRAARVGQFPELHEQLSRRLAALDGPVAQDSVAEQPHETTKVPAGAPVDQPQPPTVDHVPVLAADVTTDHVAAGQSLVVH